MKIYHSSCLLRLFPKWVSGFAFGSRVFFRNGEASVSPVLLNHERIHVCQYREQGIFRFLFRYFVLEFRKPYREKSAEVEAYENQENLNYVSERWPEYADVLH